MPRYNPVLHTRANQELNELPEDERKRISDTIKEICECEKPTSHEKTKHLKGQAQAFRIREGEVRAVAKLDKPLLKILKVGRRNGVYADIDAELKARS